MAVFTFRGLLIVLLTVSSSFFAVSYGWCSRYDSSSCSSRKVCCNHLCISGSSCFGFVPLIPTAPSLRVAVAVDADLSVLVIHVLVTEIVDPLPVVTENARTIQTVILLQPLSSAQCVAFSFSLVCSPCAFTALAEGVEFTMEE